MKLGSVPTPRIAWRRLPLLVLGILSLVAGVYGGLTRLPINLPLPVDHANWLSYHGPLMVCGFLGTVIGLERAVGLPHIWAYAAPLLTGTGALALIVGLPGRTGAMLFTLGSMVFVLVTLRVLQLQRALFTATMSLGGGCWLVGNLLWWLDWPIASVVPWWIAFLTFTITGERLDLSRFQKPDPRARPLFFAASGMFLTGVALGAPWPSVGGRLAGVGLVALAVWLARFDLARQTIRQPGLPRFMALSLLMGYGWLAVCGVWLLAAGSLQPGPAYDAALHAFFLGFVFSMIFAHAPVIFPSIVRRPITFHPRFYTHVALLHGSLVLRLAADFVRWPEGRQWGGVLNAVTLALFLVNTLTAMILRRRPQDRKRTGPTHPLVDN